MEDAPFTYSYMNYDPERYEELLQEKIECVKRLLTSKSFVLPSEITVIKSSSKHFRNRCRFEVLHYEQDGRDCIRYAMWEHGTPSVEIVSFPMASKPIFDVMAALRDLIPQQPSLVTELRRIHFLCTEYGELVISMFYSAPIDEDWRLAATWMKGKVDAKTISGLRRGISVIGRSRKIKLVVGQESVMERFHLEDGRELVYVQREDGFSNPNAGVNARALHWICHAISLAKQFSNNVSNSNNSDGSAEVVVPFNLLEMYCGNGNHTVAIANAVNRIVAVELNGALCDAARENLQINGISNVTVIKGDCFRFAQTVLRRMAYTIKQTGETVQFNAVLVDPPRCGLDKYTCELVSRYNTIVYISCSPDSLARDLSTITKTHDIANYAVFDQFAYTSHLESGVILRKRVE